MERGTRRNKCPSYFQTEEKGNIRSVPRGWRWKQVRQEGTEETERRRSVDERHLKRVDVGPPRQKRMEVTWSSYRTLNSLQCETKHIQDPGTDQISRNSLTVYVEIWKSWIVTKSPRYLCPITPPCLILSIRGLGGSLEGTTSIGTEPINK